ncbi:MAG: hypothetical protein WDN04_26785 [Rhodospirillales bacterium]
MAAEGGSSTYPARALLMEEPPSIDAGEITDKGYINQRAVLVRRAALVIQLYTETPGPKCSFWCIRQLLKQEPNLV